MNLEEVMEIAAEDKYLAVISTLRADGTIQASVVNAGAMADPTTGLPVVGFVTYGRAKLDNLRARPQVTITFRAGWRWGTVEGRAELITAGETLRQLRRDVFVAAGGTHDDWDEYDRVMEEQQRVVVLVAPTRIYSNRR
jgi:PPOX class probable F420-dependent enzyme